MAAPAQRGDGLATVCPGVANNNDGLFLEFLVEIFGQVGYRDVDRIDNVSAVERLLIADIDDARALINQSNGLRRRERGKATGLQA